VHTVHVNLAERSYDIEFGAGNLGRAGAMIARHPKVSHAVIITDENVQNPHALEVAKVLGQELHRVDVVVVDPGEQSKSIEVAMGLWNGLLELGTDRKSVIVAVGGGVVGALAGFVAATYARGLRFFQVPTSLLAQVDSSVGGKVGINLPEAKNMVGAFLQPLGVLVDTDTLATLPDREYRAGLGEVGKYGVILDADLFAYLEGHAEGLLARDAEVLTHVIGRCCRLKADVVETDEREDTGRRAVLNYGHTFAHAVESLTGYTSLLHGEAVAVGMICASRLAEQLGRVDAGLTDRQRRLLVDLGLPVDLPKLDRKKMLAAMMRDKKAEHGRMRFVLPDRLGHVEMVDNVAAEDVRAVL